MIESEKAKERLNKIMSYMDNAHTAQVFSLENEGITDGLRDAIKNSNCTVTYRIESPCNSRPVRDFLCPTCRNYTMIPDGISGVKDCEFCGSEVRYSDEQGAPND